MLHEIKPHAAELFGVVRGPELHLFNHGAFFFDDREHLPEGLVEKLRLQRYEFLFHELVHH